MKRRRVGVELDLSSWPEFDPGVLTKAQRTTFAAWRCALELYVANTAVAVIEERTGVNRRQIYRLLDNCTALHDDGRAFGWRALVPHVRVSAYRRTAKVQRQRDGLGAVGAFGLLLEAYLAQSRVRRLLLTVGIESDQIFLLHDAFYNKAGRALRPIV